MQQFPLLPQPQPMKRTMNKQRTSIVMDYTELFYHEETNSMYELIKQFKNTAVVRLQSAGGGDYLVVTMPHFVNGNISWGLPYHCESKQAAIDTAKGIDRCMAEFNNIFEFRDVAEDVKTSIGNHHDGYHFDPDKTLDDLLEQHSYDEIKTVLAVFIYDHEHDGRISVTNKNWAKEYISENGIDTNKLSNNIAHLQHNILVNALADEMREYEDKNQVLDLTKDSGRK